LANNNDNFYSLESGPIFSKNYLNVLSQIQSLKFMIKKKSVIFNIPTLQNLISTLPNYYCLSVILFLLMKNFKIHYFIIYFFSIFLNLKKKFNNSYFQKSNFNIYKCLKWYNSDIRMIAPSSLMLLLFYCFKI